MGGLGGAQGEVKSETSTDPDPKIPSSKQGHNQSYYERDDESGPDTNGPRMVEKPAGQRRRTAAKPLDARHDYSLLRFLDCLLRDSTNLVSVGSTNGDLEFRRPPIASGWLVEVLACNCADRSSVESP